MQKARKLHGRIDFQGLPISVENREGSRRYWYDPEADEHGSTKMKYPYGYVKGTLGLDGDAVDVFVGPDAESDLVVVITQLKRPDFSKIDEQKVMLGFSSAKQAKQAYLKHYNDPRFFGSMKTLTISEFKDRLKTHRGKLIKHLYLDTTSASIQASVEYSGGNIVSKDAVAILKGLTSRMLSTMHNSKRVEATPVVDSGEDIVEVAMTGPMVAQAMHVHRPFEQPVAPKVSIATPFQAAAPTTPDFMTSCGSCGYVHKSLGDCPRCSTLGDLNREAAPIWRR